ncbi:hypothetical protein MBLNU457_g2734t2 [Dothideomycetes sp. NU457]
MASNSAVTPIRLYRRCLKLALDWTIQRHMWRGQAMYIRSLFENNRHITEPRQQRGNVKRTELQARREGEMEYHGRQQEDNEPEHNIAAPLVTLPPRGQLFVPDQPLTILSQEIMMQTEALLQKWKHPDPYRPPTAPGGSKYERNLPAPILDPPPHMTL